MLGYFGTGLRDKNLAEMRIRLRDQLETACKDMRIADPKKAGELFATLCRKLQGKLQAESINIDPKCWAKYFGFQEISNADKIKAIGLLEAGLQAFVQLGHLDEKHVKEFIESMFRDSGFSEQESKKKEP